MDYDQAIAKMERWRAVERWLVWILIGSPLLLFLCIPLDKFLLGWFLLVGLAVYTHCSRLRWRQVAETIDKETEHAQTDDSD